MNVSDSQTLFLRLPLELRLEIYGYLLLHKPTSTGTTNSSSVPLPRDYHDYETGSSDLKTDSSTICIRAQDPGVYKSCSAKPERSAFIVRAGGMRGRCVSTTYISLDTSGIYTSLLLANAQIHTEAVEVLYSNHTFDFDTHIEALVAFLTDLTPFARNCVRSIRLVKRALPYETQFDRFEFATAMEMLGNLGKLRSLSLGIVAGRPGLNGWDMVPTFKLEHYDFVKSMEGMEWIEHLLTVKGLERVEVDAVIEHCPLPRSAAMARYIQFSASIESSFADFLQERMVCKV